MRRFLLLLIFISCYSLFTACTTATPENCFALSVLSCNMMHGFAGDGLQRELENPGVKLVEGTTDKTIPMKRKEIIDSKIQYIESSMEKINDLKQMEDNKEMLQASIALHEYVLPVYKNEYHQLAKLYDDGASQEQIQSFGQSIQDKYYPGFGERFDKLIVVAKPYAEKHHIQVNWDVRTSPR